MSSKMPSRSQVERLRKRYPEGCRIQMIQMDDPYAPIPFGTKGTVQSVDDAGQIQMNWDNGRTLAIVPGVDQFKVITNEKN